MNGVGYIFIYVFVEQIYAYIFSRMWSCSTWLLVTCVFYLTLYNGYGLNSLNTFFQLWFNCFHVQTFDQLSISYMQLSSYSWGYGLKVCFLTFAEKVTVLFFIFSFCSVFNDFISLYRPAIICLTSLLFDWCLGFVTFIIPSSTVINRHSGASLTLD